MMNSVISRLKGFWPFTIKFYAFSFMILMSLTFGILGWGMQYKLDSIRDDAAKRNKESATAEIRYVIGHIIEEINTRAQALSVQDETRHQFYDPAYYHYWRDIRILAGNVFPSFARAVELYNSTGQALQGKTLGNMPRSIIPRHLQNYVQRESNRYFIYLFHPVTITEGKHATTLGYIGFKLDLIDALKNEQRFNHFSVDALTIRLADQERIPLDQLFPFINFELTPNRETLELTTSIERFQRQILFSMIVLYFVFYLMLTSILSAPLRRLSLHIDNLRNGKGGLLSPSYTKSLPLAELEKVRISLNDYQNKLEEMHLNLNEKNDELWQLAHHDPLTGVYNRRGFEEDWKHMLAVSSGHRLGVALILFDCDHFKAINDTYGHPTGDQVIQAITRTLQQTLRHGDRLYRLGGDEFATMFLDIDKDLAVHTAERCIEAVSRFDFNSLGIKEPVRISAGLAFAVGTEPETLSKLPKQADVAMYHAKRPGKSKIAVFDQEMFTNSNILFSNSINNLVFRVMSNDELLEMHYMPIANLATGQVDYYEALVRIRDGENLIMPSTIFPIIEDRRLESEFDIVVLSRIAKEIEAGKIPANKGVTFNVSGPGIIDLAVQKKILELAKYLDRYKLIIEITETALITQLHVASAILNNLRQKGFRIALDDFGSGYSSLSYLSNMPVDCVKFDVSLIRQLFDDSRQSTIIENLVDMVNKAGYDIVAEGVENEAILERIAELGFNRGQGFIFGRADKICRELPKLKFFDIRRELPATKC